MSLTFLDVLISEKKKSPAKGMQHIRYKGFVCVVYTCVIHGYTDTFS